MHVMMITTPSRLRRAHNGELLGGEGGGGGGGAHDAPSCFSSRSL